MWEPVPGVDDVDSYEALCNFIDTVHRDGGITHFIIHARKCLLKGLSPAENRSIPPLRYGTVPSPAVHAGTSVLRSHFLLKT